MTTQTDPVTIELPRREEFDAESTELMTLASACNITDIETHSDAQRYLTRVASAINVVKRRFAPIKRQAHGLHKSIVAMETDVLAPFVEARREWSNKVIEYDNAQRLIEEEKQRKLEAEAKQREEERALNDAIAAENAGEFEEAAEILEEAAHEATPVVEVETERAKVSGVTTAVTWSAEVIDFEELIVWVAQNIEFSNLLKANQSALNALARAQRENLRVGGVTAIGKRGLRAQGA